MNQTRFGMNRYRDKVKAEEKQNQFNKRNVEKTKQKKTKETAN